MRRLFCIAFHCASAIFFFGGLIFLIAEVLYGQ